MTKINIDHDYDDDDLKDAIILVPSDHFNFQMTMNIISMITTIIMNIVMIILMTIIIIKLLFKFPFVLPSTHNCFRSDIIFI